MVQSALTVTLMTLLKITPKKSSSMSNKSVRERASRGRNAQPGSPVGGAAVV